MSSKTNITGTSTLTTLITLIKTALNGKVDNAEGKVLSSNDFTDAEKEKLANIEAYANKTQIIDDLSGCGERKYALSANQGFELGQKVENLESKLSITYKASGSRAFASLPAADEAHLGMVYNITDEFTTTDKFREGAGKTYPAGTNVVIVIEDDKSYKYDVLSGFVDLSGYVASSDVQELTAEEVTSLWNSITV